MPGLQKPVALILFLIFTGFVFSSCGVVKNGTVTERPEENFAETGSLIQEGQASWYGPKFHGKLTANGEIYDMDDLTAAHRTLPFNTKVRVTNKANGKSVDVRINDRGPYVGNRIIDLSRQAAREIDMMDAGVGNITINLLNEGDRPITSSNSSSRESFTVQLASFDTEQRAVEESGKISGSEVVQIPVGGRNIYRVYYGTYTSAADAEKKMREMRRRGIVGFVKQREN
ncbi:MAG: septal ring lytic transglycosylase RlpA family protein [Balneolaceae bacterium]